MLLRKMRLRDIPWLIQGQLIYSQEDCNSGPSDFKAHALSQTSEARRAAASCSSQHRIFSDIQNGKGENNCEAALQGLVVIQVPSQQSSRWSTSPTLQRRKLRFREFSASSKVTKWGSEEQQAASMSHALFVTSGLSHKWLYHLQML